VIIELMRKRKSVSTFLIHIITKLPAIPMLNYLVTSIIEFTEQNTTLYVPLLPINK